MKGERGRDGKMQEGEGRESEREGVGGKERGKEVRRGRGKEME